MHATASWGVFFKRKLILAHPVPLFSFILYNNIKLNKIIYLSSADCPFVSSPTIVSPVGEGTTILKLNIIFFRLTKPDSYALPMPNFYETSRTQRKSLFLVKLQNYFHGPDTLELPGGYTKKNKLHTLLKPNY